MDEQQPLAPVTRLTSAANETRKPCSVRPGFQSAADGFFRDSEVNCVGIRATILLRIDWLSGLIGALLW